MADIVFLKSIEDEDKVIEISVNDGSKIIPLTFSTYQSLKNHGIKSSPGWEYASYEDIINVLKEEHKIINSIWVPFFSKKYEYINPKIILFPLILFIDEALVSNLIIERILEQEKPSKIINYVTTKKIPCNEGDWHCSVFDSILEYICNDRSIRYYVLPSAITEAPYLRKKKYYIIIQAICKSLVGLFFLPFLVTYMALYHKRIIFDTLDHEERLRHTWLFKMLRQHTSYKILSLDQSFILFCTVPLFNLLLKIINKRKHYLDLMMLIKAFEEYKSTCSNYASIVKNPILSYQWQHLVNQIADYEVMAKHSVESINNLVHPYAAILSMAQHPYRIAQSLAFNKKRVKTIIVPHATITYNYPDLYNHYNTIITTNQYNYNKYVEMDIPAKKLICINEGRHTSRASIVDKAISKKKYNIDQNKIILVITRNIQAGCGYFPKWETKLSMSKFYNHIISCTKIVSCINDCTLIIKSHPLRDYYEFYSILANSNNNVIHIRIAPIGDLLTIAKVIIFVGPFMDAFFTAIMYNKHIIYCNTGIDSHITSKIADHVAIVDEPADLLDNVRRCIDSKKQPEYEDIRKIFLSCNEERVDNLLKI